MAALRRASASKVLTALLASFFLFASPLASASPSAAATSQDMCAAQYAAAQAVKAQIAAHNAEPHEFTLPQEEGAYAAYNTEAASLNAEGAAAVAAYTACFDAMMALSDATGSGNLNLKDLTPTRRASIDQGKNRLGAGWRPPPPPAAGKNWRVPKSSPLRPLYDAVRDGNPGNLPYTYLKGGMKLPVGAPDPAYPAASGKVIAANANGGPAVTADHIVPLAELVQMPGFAKGPAPGNGSVSRDRSARSAPSPAHCHRPFCPWTGKTP